MRLSAKEQCKNLMFKAECEYRITRVKMQATADTENPTPQF